MRIRLGSAAYVALALAFLSCSDSGPLSPVAPLAPQLDVAATALPAVRISEFHYDNAGTDANETIEISGPVGTNLTGWTLVLYNGNSGSRAPYTTTNLSGSILSTCGARGVLTFTYPSNGIQNGGSGAATTDPDGIALVNGSTVVEFLSYEGSFQAASGPAAGMTSTDIGVRELGTESANPVTSLKRDGAGTWYGPDQNSFGTCNDEDEVVPPAEVADVVATPDQATVTVGSTQQFSAVATDAAGNAISGVTIKWSSGDTTIAKIDSTSGLALGRSIGDVMIIARVANGVADTSSLRVNPVPPPALPETRFSEIHYDNFNVDTLERIEIEGPAGKDLTGWSVVLYNGNGGVTYNTAVFSTTNTSVTGVVIPATCTTRGVLVVSYPRDGIQNGSPDGMALVDNTGAVVEFLSYEGTFAATNGPAVGLMSKDIGVSENSSPIGQSLQRDGAGDWAAPGSASFGVCNGIDTPPPPPPVNFLTFTGRVPTDPALPVGFEDQLFATEHLGTGGTATTTFTWTSETPNVASIDANGVMHALSAGTATFRATAADGTTGTYTLPTIVATASTTAQYGNNTEFGDPTDWDDSDDFIVRRAQFTTSFNKNRNTPNWVSYDLEATHIGSEVDRCDCFTHDPALPSSYTHITTANYTGAGGFAGYGIDRGHLARSFDRTTGNLDNATTYYFSNIIPQAADMNQGPWAILENHLGDLARNQDKEVYIVAGVAGSIGTVKDSGKLVIPEKVWKVAVIMPRDHGLSDVRDYRDLEVVAVIMPNVPGIRNVDWHTYETTIDAIEALSGYDLLSLLPDKVERAVESNTKPPFAKLDGPYAADEGSSVSMSGAASFDQNGTVSSYVWSFGDGIESSGSSLSHTYAQDGDYTVRLIVTDNDGLADTTTSAVHISNVAPTILPFDGATLLPGETYRADGSFTDPGADTWSGTVNYGDGTGAGSLALAGKTFSLSHAYGSAGTFTVTVGISDDDATSTSTRTITVWTSVQGVRNASALVLRLAKEEKLTAGNANSLTAKLDAATKQLDRGNTNAASGQLGAVLNELDAMVRSGRLAEADAAPLRSIVQRLLQSIAR